MNTRASFRFLLLLAASLTVIAPGAGLRAADGKAGSEKEKRPTLRFDGRATNRHPVLVHFAK